MRLFLSTSIFLCLLTLLPCAALAKEDLQQAPVQIPEDAPRMTEWKHGGTAPDIAPKLSVNPPPIIEEDVTPLAERTPIAIQMVKSGNIIIPADGRTVQLAGFIPAHMNAQDALQVFAKQPELFLETVSTDFLTNYPNVLADLYSGFGAEEKSAVVSLLEQGFGYVDPLYTDYNHAIVAMAAEAKARAKKAGMWAQKEWQPITSNKAYTKIGTYAFVIGRVGSVTPVNNGAEYIIRLGKSSDKQRLTLRLIDTDLRKYWGHIGATYLADKLILVRGEIYDQNGAQMMLRSPWQIEFLQDNEAGEAYARMIERQDKQK